MVVFRYLNIDYILASALANDVKAGIKDVVVTYDIACQWAKNLTHRLPTYSSVPPLDLNALNSFRVAVPKFHPLGARGPGNQRKHLEYIAGSG